METLRELSLAAALVTTGLMAGVYLAFSIAVLPGIGRQDDRTFVLAMRGMNAAILNGWFAVVFGGPLLIGAVAVATRLPSGERDALGWASLSLVLYVSTLVITGAVNVPLNNRLDTTEPVDEARALFERRWQQWNVVRTLACAASFVSLVAAIS